MYRTLLLAKLVPLYLKLKEKLKAKAKIEEAVENAKKEEELKSCKEKEDVEEIKEDGSVLDNASVIDVYNETKPLYFDYPSVNIQRSTIPVLKTN
jgi:ubiquinone/menaquinone biosynthesis C-methylase UbiE